MKPEAMRRRGDLLKARDISEPGKGFGLGAEVWDIAAELCARADQWTANTNHILCHQRDEIWSRLDTQNQLLELIAYHLQKNDGAR